MAYLRITEENIEKEHICCAMSNNQSAQKKEWLKERFGDKLNLVEVVTNPTAGSHCGPNGLGLSFRVSSR